jgi:ATP-dependent DNA helicase RecG
MSFSRSQGIEVSVRTIRGIGPERAAQLERLNILTVEDLLLHRPRNYEDRRHLQTIRELQLGKVSTTRGRIVAQGVKRYRKGTRSVFEFVLDDGTAPLHCRWWNQPFMEDRFQIGNEVMLSGKLRDLKPRIMDNPETEIIEPGDEPSVHLERIVPIYPLTEGLTQRWLRGLIWRSLAEYEPRVTEPWPELTLPDLPARAEAIRQLHFPPNMEDAVKARQRLALDEFITLQIEIQRRRLKVQTVPALPCAGDNRLIRPLLRQLGFTLTEAQTKVLRDLRHDLGGAHPMRRLLQGDVGSGKTIVAACCALMTLESGFNVVLMAPTEILAEQHYATFQRWLSPLRVGVELQTGARKTAAGAIKTRSDEESPEPMLPLAASPHRAASAAPRLFIGTHALIQTGFAIDKLGLVIIDEQHKFGVAQREELVRKGRYPHLLVMTATPIPRTLGLTLYGDLDVSVIDEIPSGRGRVRTFLRSPAQLPKVYEFLRQKIAEGRQAYIVYPRVEESDEVAGIKAVVAEFEKLRDTFAPHRVGMLHGRLRIAEKEAVMADFRANRTRILLATSVIEVGVDVPNATLMLIEQADQFGLASLHQLRGRVGRGAHESFCILVANPRTDQARERLRVMESTTDGFEIAEADLRLRGPGELLGQQQSGGPDFRFGDLALDAKLILQARDLAKEILKQRARGSEGS